MSIDISKDHGPAYLRHVRQKSLDMTQEQFADLMGVSVATLRNWEQGQTPVPKYFDAALHVFGADPAAALAALGTARSYDGPAAQSWDYIGEGPGRHARAMAVDRIKSEPQACAMMGIAQDLKKFQDAARDLGWDFDRKELLGLAILAQLSKAD